LRTEAITRSATSRAARLGVAVRPWQEGVDTLAEAADEAGQHLPSPLMGQAQALAP
jgi:hypothetical protein